MRNFCCEDHEGMASPRRQRAHTLPLAAPPARALRARGRLGRAALLLTLTLAASSGCGLGLLQTAKTTPKGQVDVTLGSGYIENDLNEARGGISLSNLPPVVNVRVGITDQVDVGARMLFVTGLLADAKVNLLPAASSWALSLQGGVGGALDLGGDALGKVLHVPLSVLASYTIIPQITPYGAVGYGTFWIFGRDEDRQEDVTYAEREGHGDGVVQLTAGVQLANARQSVALCLEYNYWHPVLNDPGDFYELVASHFVMGGVRF